jgi:hypothetical protein
VFGYLTDPQVLGVLFVLLSVVAAIALVTLLLFSRLKGKLEESVANASEWQPTSKIDFYCINRPRDDKAPATFVLRVEDQRIVESISGVTHTEIRWRNATLAEAKSVVAAYQKATDTETKVHQIPRPKHS